MTTIQRLALLGIAFCLASCNVVTSPSPFGLKPVGFSSPDYHPGTWRDDSGNKFEVSVVNKEEAILRVTLDDPKSAEKPRTRTVKAQILAGKKWQYVSVPRAEDGSIDAGYLFFCIFSEPTRTIIWNPDRTKFKNLVMRGILPGKVVKEDVILGKITPEIIDLIESEQHGLLFEWQNPIILKKVTTPSAKSP